MLCNINSCARHKLGKLIMHLKTILICLLYICSSHCFQVKAQTSKWDGTQEKINKGIGTKTDPFVISKASQFAYLCEGYEFEGKYFLLQTDIDLGNRAWTPIGAFESSPFKGNIDFNNHCIYNMKVSGERAIGLFGYICNASISNLVIKSSQAEGVNLIGGIVAYAKESDINNVTSYITVNSTGGRASVGGIVGTCENSHISNVFNYGSVSNNDKEQHDNPRTNAQIGGIVGNSINSTIEKCGNLGKVNAYSVMATAIYSAAGIVGNATSNSIVRYCFNKGDVSCNLRYVRWYNDGTQASVSGISKGGTPYSCYNTGIISGCSYWSGSYASITSTGGCDNCFSTWSINGCQADSYTCKSEKLNGIKISIDELNTIGVIKILNNGENVFVKDEYPYLNNGTPYINGFKSYKILTDDAINITTSTALLQGALCFSGYSVVRKGFMYKKCEDKDYKCSYCFDNTLLLDELMPNQKYNYFFFAELEDGTLIKGDVKEFTTEQIKTEIYTTEINGISENSAIINGAIILNNNESLENVGVEYFTINGEILRKTAILDTDRLPYFEIKIDALSASTEYKCRLFAKLNVGTLYGDYNTFKTSKSTGIKSVEMNKNNISVHGNQIIVTNVIGNQLVIYLFNGTIYKILKPNGGIVSCLLPSGNYIVNGNKVLIP